MSTTAPSSTPTDLPRPEPRLRRSVNGSLGGVAQGIANFTGIEAKWVRLAFLASVLFGGFGFLLYVSAWVGVPDEHDPRPARFAVTQSVTRLVIAAIFAVFTLGSLTGTAGISAGLLFPALLVGGGVYLLSQNNDSAAVGGQHPKASSPPPAPMASASPPPPTTVPPAPAPQQPVDDRDPLLIEAERLMSGEAYVHDPLNPAPEPAHWALTRNEQEEVAVRRKRPPVVAFALGAASLVSVLLLSTDSGADFFVYAFIFLGFAVFGFIASLFFRRPAWALIPAGVIAFGLGMGGLFATASFEQGFGEVTINVDAIGIPGNGDVPASSDIPAIPQIPDVPGIGGDTEFIQTFEHGVGELTFDLDGLELSQDVTLDAELGVGVLKIRIPDEVRTAVVLVDGDQIEFEDGETSGFSSGSTLIFNSEIDGPTLTINADVELGQIEVDANSDDYELENR